MSFTAAETPLPVTNPEPPPLPSEKLVRYEGNPLVRNGPEPYDFYRVSPRAVLKMGPGDYRMWYEAVAGDWLTTVGYATSRDGLKWVKRGVVLSPSEPWEMEEICVNSVIFDGGIYKLWYHGGGYVRGKRRLGHGRVGYATSKDGVTWTKYQGNPVLDIGPANTFDSNQTADPRVFHLPDGYRMYYTGQEEEGRQLSLGMATSPDGVHWTKYAGNPILDARAWGFWSGALFPENGIWHLWYGSINPDGGGRSNLRYKWSTDGITWKDGPTNPVLLQNPDPKAPDYGLSGDSVCVYRDGDTYRILYTGHNSNLFGKLGRFMGICMASIKAAKQ